MVYMKLEADTKNNYRNLRTGKTLDPDAMAAVSCIIKYLYHNPDHKIKKLFNATKFYFMFTTPRLIQQFQK